MQLAKSAVDCRQVTKVVARDCCSHCGDDLGGAEIYDGDHAFCCAGCRVVYNCLNNNGLGFYYELSEKEGRDLEKAQFNHKYIYLKDPEFLKEFEQENQTFVFYVKGIECLACTWLFENLSSLSEAISHAEYTHENKTIEIKVRDNTELYEALIPIVNLGYELKPLKNITEASRLNIQKKRNDLIRLAVTMAVMGNINLFSLSHYFGLEVGSFSTVFSYISAGIFLFIPFYAATPFYKTSLDFLKKKKVSLDLPISFSIVMGSLLSYIAVFQGSSHYYFDSIATFVFLILAVRFFLDGLYQKESEYDLLEEIYAESQVYLKEQGKMIPKHISQVQIGDIIQVSQGGILPLEGVVAKGESFVNEALLSGEATPILKKVGDEVYAGSLNYSSFLDIKVTKALSETTLASYLGDLKSKKQVLGGYSSFSKYYAGTLSVVFVLLSVLLFSLLSFDEASSRVLSLVIICCPCALGIGIPLVTLIANRSLLRKGIIIKKPDFLGQLQKVKKIYFDKTGTLTTGLFDVFYVSGDKKYIDHTVALENLSSHPIAKAVCGQFSATEQQQVEQFKEVIGQGPEGYIDDVFYQIRRGKTRGQIDLLKEGEAVLTFGLKEQYRVGVHKLLEKLKDKYELFILSGDSNEGVQAFLKEAKLPSMKAFSALTPQEKKDKITFRDSLYIGDGLNDIPALSKTGLSISLNALPLVDQASDCIFMNSDLNKLESLFLIFHKSKKAIMTNIFISILYNILGVGLAVTGICSPLLAAIFMPISSGFVVAHTFFRGRRF